MIEGLAEYREPGKPATRLLVNEAAMKQMNTTFPGRPVYVSHVDQVDLTNLQLEADGYVVESFFNQADGKNWAKFIVVSDKGHDAIAKGWKLSNAYVPKEFGSGGVWHGIDYDKTVLAAEYNHLAIVPNPRYQESRILTPEQFKLYNEQKEAELLRIANSNDDEKNKGENQMLNFFKKTKVENSTDFENMVVELPKSKKQKTIAQLVNETDDYELKMKEPQMANMEHMVEHNGEKMTLSNLMEKHAAMCSELEEMKKKHPDEPAKNEEEEKKKKAADDEAKKNAEAEAKKKEEEEKAKKNHMEAIKNAGQNPAPSSDDEVLLLSNDKAELGKKRYGSKK